jgi:hypothetical protein
MPLSRTAADIPGARGGELESTNARYGVVPAKGDSSWEVIRKMKGRTLLTAHWTLSEDRKTLNDAFTQYLPDGTTLFSQPLPNGSTFFLPYLYERTAGN